VRQLAKDFGSSGINELGDKNESVNLDKTSEEKLIREARSIPCTVELVKINTRVRVEEIGTMAFEQQKDNRGNESSKFGDEDIADDAEMPPSDGNKLENWMFGDVAAVIELYNAIVPYYKTSGAKPRKTVSRRVKKGKKAAAAATAALNEAKMSEVTVTSIEYETLVNALNGENKPFFVQLIRNLLFIYIKREEVFGVSIIL
jgi:hypothetical protein